MGVQLWVVAAARPVLERHRRPASGGDPLIRLARRVVPTSGPRAQPLQILDRLPHRRPVRIPDRLGHPRLTQPEQHRHALRGRERQIQPGPAYVHPAVREPQRRTKRVLAIRPPEHLHRVQASRYRQPPGHLHRQRRPRTPRQPGVHRERAERASEHALTRPAGEHRPRRHATLRRGHLDRPHQHRRRQPAPRIPPPHRPHQLPALPVTSRQQPAQHPLTLGAQHPGQPQGARPRATPHPPRLALPAGVVVQRATSLTVQVVVRRRATAAKPADRQHDNDHSRPDPRCMP